MSTFMTHTNRFSERFYFYFLVILLFLIAQPVMTFSGMYTQAQIMIVNQIAIGFIGYARCKVLVRRYSHYACSWAFTLGKSIFPLVAFIGMVSMSVSHSPASSSLFTIGGYAIGDIACNISSNFNLYAVAMIWTVLLMAEIGTDYVEFFGETAVELRREVKRITWPSHHETLRFVGIVSVFVTCSALFWWLMDGVITRILSLIIKTLSSFS